MSWLDANDYLVMDLTARERVQDLGASRAVSAAADDRAARGTALLSTGALVLGLLGLAGFTDCTAATRDEAPAHASPATSSDDARGVSGRWER